MGAEAPASALLAVESEVLKASNGQSSAQLKRHAPWPACAAMLGRGPLIGAPSPQQRPVRRQGRHCPSGCSSAAGAGDGARSALTLPTAELCSRHLRADFPSPLLQKFVAPALKPKPSAAAMPPPPPRPATTAAPAARPDSTPAAKKAADPQILSYEISPYRSGSESDDDSTDKPKKPVPAWARRHAKGPWRPGSLSAPSLLARVWRGSMTRVYRARSDALGPVLYSQIKTDPDLIFANSVKTCSLDAVFEASKPRNSRRGSSGNWAEDRLTWKARGGPTAHACLLSCAFDSWAWLTQSLAAAQEELRYKRAMGFAASTMAS